MAYWNMFTLASSKLKLGWIFTPLEHSFGLLPYKQGCLNLKIFYITVILNWKIWNQCEDTRLRFEVENLAHISKFKLSYNFTSAEITMSISLLFSVTKTTTKLFASIFWKAFKSLLRLYTLQMMTKHKILVHAYNLQLLYFL